MAKLTFILVNSEKIAFMYKVAEYNTGVIEQGILTISVTAPQLVIKREWADEILGLKEKDADSRWRSLTLNYQGKIVKFSNDEIIIIDHEKK